MVGEKLSLQMWIIKIKQQEMTVKIGETGESGKRPPPAPFEGG